MKKILLMTIVFVISFKFLSISKGFINDINDKTLVKYYYDDNNFYKGGYFPIDDNNDGIFEYYYFNSFGHLYINAKTPIGLNANEKGQILIDGNVIRVNKDEIFDIEKNIDVLRELNKSKYKYNYKNSDEVKRVLKEYKEDFNEYVLYFYNLIDKKTIEYYKTDNEIKAELYMYIDKLDTIYNKYIKEIKDLKLKRDISEDSFNFLKESIDKDYKNSINIMRNLLKSIFNE